MKKMLTASLVMLATLFAAANVAAATTKEISPHPLGERSVFSERALVERVEPVGSVCVEGEDCGAAAQGAEVAGGPRSGEQVYNGACAACHATGAAGAPKVGDAGAWSARIGKGMGTLVDNAINGFNAMPPKGMCTDCSDDELKAAVEYMVENSK